MAYYSDELIEEVRSRNDIVDVISGYVRLTKKGNTGEADVLLLWMRSRRKCIYLSDAV